MGRSLEGRLARLESLLQPAVYADGASISTQALQRISGPELKLIVAGLRRLRDALASMPIGTVATLAMWREYLTEEELAAYRRWKTLEAEFRALGA